MQGVGRSDDVRLGPAHASSTNPGHGSVPRSVTAGRAAYLWSSGPRQHHPVLDDPRNSEASPPRGSASGSRAPRCAVFAATHRPRTTGAGRALGVMQMRAHPNVQTNPSWRRVPPMCGAAGRIQRPDESGPMPWNEAYPLLRGPSDGNVCGEPANRALLGCRLNDGLYVRGGPADQSRANAGSPPCRKNALIPASEGQ